MHNRKIIIGFFTALLLLMVFVCGYADAQLHPQAEEALEKFPFTLLLQQEQTMEIIKPWPDSRGGYYVFLPSGARLSQTFFRLTEEGTVRIGKRSVSDGDDCGFVRLDKTYKTEFSGNGGIFKFSLTFLQSENLPSVHVDINSGNMTYIHRYKENAEPAELRIILPDGDCSYSGSLEAVKGHGNATWAQEKKSYNLKLRREESLLGMGAAQNWILLSNVFDPSHIRNRIVFDAARETGLAYTPDSRWVDLYLNGSYAGVYLLCEKNEVHPQRVDIDQDSSVLVSIEKEDRLWEYGNSQFLTEHGIPIRVRHSGGDMKFLQEKLQSAENAILAPDGIDPVSGKHWSALIDTESWAKKYLIEEVFGNLDAGSISQFYYWEGNGKIYAGPVWDYDISMGNPHDWQLESPQMLFAGRPHLWNPEDTPWLYALYQKPTFRETVTELYEKQFQPALHQLLEDGLDQYEEQIRSAAAMDRVRWSTDSCSDTVEAIKSYMHRRLKFLDSLWLREEEYHLVSVYIQEHVMACYAMEDGAIFPEMPVPDGTDTIFYEAWYDADTDQPFDFSASITGDKLIYLKEVNLLEAGGEDRGLSLRKTIAYVPLAVMLVIMAAMLIKEKSTAGKEAQARYDESKIST